jgi:hypothetical protein
MYYHRRNASFREGKTRWVIKENEEFDLFNQADKSNWFCTKLDGYLSFDLVLKIIGEHGQVLAFFPKTQNDSDPYHGFPIHSWEKLPSDELLDNWVKFEHISSVTKRRIERQMI